MPPGLSIPPASDPAADRAAPDLPAALVRWAAERPEAPWLFHPEGLDWRWVSFADAAAEVERLAPTAAAALAAAALAPPAAVSFVYEPRPAHVLLDLALQRAGYTAAPQPAGEPLRHRELVAPDAAIPDANPRAVEPRTVEPRAAEPPAAQPPAAALGEVPPGGVEVRAAGGTLRTLGAAELAAWAAALEHAVAAAAPRRRPEREVVVSGPDLADPVERRVLAWSLQRGAALLLEPTAARRVATAGWARPTVFHGTPDEIAALGREAAHHDREGFAGLRRRLGRPPVPDLPFRRLHTVLAAPFPGEDAWEARGVRRVDPGR